MTIHHMELNSTDRRQLAELAARTGNDAVRDAVNAYLEQWESPEAECPGFEEDTEYLNFCMEELRGLEARFGPEALTDEESHRILSKVGRSAADLLNEDRGEQ